MKTLIHNCSHSHPPRPLKVVYCRSGSIRLWCWSSPLTVLRFSRQTTSLCLLFSQSFPRYYDVDDRELLAVKLKNGDTYKGGRASFCDLDNHKNLIYLRTAKRLRAHQARWSLFYACFNVAVSYNHIPASSGKTVIITIFNSLFVF